MMHVSRVPRAATAALCGLAATVALAACGGSDDGGAGAAAAADGREPFVVGAALGLTGACAQGDASALLGIEHQVAQLNAAGGLDGREVELVTKDMQSKPAVAGRVTQELISEGAGVILGPCLAGNGIATAEAAGAEGVPTILVTNTVPLPAEVMDKGMTFFAGFSDNTQAAAAAEYAIAQGHKTALLVSSGDISYTSDTPKWFGEAFEHGGGKVVGEVSYSIGQTSFGALVTKIAAVSPEPDVIYSAMFMPDVGVFMPQLRQAGVEAAIIGADAFESQQFLDVAGDAAEGIALTTHGIVEPGTPFAELIEGIEADTGKPPEANGYAGLGADAVLLVQKAVEAAGSTEPQAIAKAISELGEVELITGDRTYAGTNGSPRQPITMAKVEGGEYVPVEDIEPSFVPEAD